MKVIKFLTLFLFAGVITAQNDTCKYKICTGTTFANTGDYAIFNAIKQITCQGIRIKSGGGGVPVTGTVTVSNNFYRQDSATVANNKLLASQWHNGVKAAQYQFLISGYTGAISNNTGSALDSLSLLISYYRDNTKLPFYYGNQSIALLQALGNNNTSSTSSGVSVITTELGGYGNSFLGRYNSINLTKSVFKTNKDSSVFLSSTAESVFLDTISLKNYTVGNSTYLTYNEISKGGGVLDQLSSQTGSNLAIKNATEYMQSQLGNGSGSNSVLLDNSGQSAFTKGSGGQSYFQNYALSDTLIENTTSMTSLVTAVNLFYAQHPNRQIKDVQYTNALVGATLTFWAILRYKD